MMAKTKNCPKFSLDQLKPDFSNPDSLRLNFFYREQINFGRNFISTDSIIDKNLRTLSGNVFIKIQHYQFMKDFLNNQIELFYEKYQDHINYLENERSKNVHSLMKSSYPYIFYVENILFWITKIVNLVICISYIEEYRKDKNKLTKKIEIDSIGKLLENKNKLGYFKPHKIFLEKLNAFHNASKHNFTGGFLENITFGGDPYVVIYNSKHNNLKELKLEHWNFKEIIQLYNDFILNIEKNFPV